MIIEELIQETMSSAQMEVNRYTYPIFIADINGKPDLIASSTAIKVEGRSYLVTASHVLLEVLRVDSPFLVGINTKYVPIKTDFIYTSNKRSDNFDIAFTELSDDFVKEHSVAVFKEEDLNIDKNFSSSHIAFIHGFPNSRNKQKKALYQTKAFRVKGYAYGGVLKKESVDWNKFDKNEALHTCITYGKTSNQQIPVHPRGISGGGLWIVPNIQMLNQIYLDSVFIEYFQRDKLAFATKIHEVVNLIKNA